MMARRINFLGGKSALVTLFGSPAHSSSSYTKLNKSPLRQYLCLGLSEVLTKHLCAGTSIASRRMCKGDDLDDGLLGLERENFQYGSQTKKR